MPEYPELPGQHEIGNPENAFDAYESRFGRAIAESVYEIIANEQSPHVLPGMGTHFGAGENRIAIAVAQALKEKGLILAKAGVDVPRYSERICLDSNKIFYVDANTTVEKGDGLSLSSPIKSLYKAIEMIRHKYDFNGYTVQIRLLPGTYGAISLNNLMLNGRLELIGSNSKETRIDSLSMENVVNDIYFKELLFKNECYFENCNTVTFENITFKSFYLIQSRLKLQGSLVIYCNTEYPLAVNDGSLVRAVGAKFVFPENLTTFTAFNKVCNQSGIIYDTCLFVQPVRTEQIGGHPFILTGSSFIKTGSNDLQLLPGNLPPQIGAGCTYDDITGYTKEIEKVQNYVDKVKGEVRSLRNVEHLPMGINAAYNEELESLREAIGECRLEIQKAIRQAGDGVTTFNLRKGRVAPKAGDYYADDIWINSASKKSIGEIVDNHAELIQNLEQSSKVTTFNNREGDIYPEFGDYNTENISHKGFPLTMALSQLNSAVKEFRDNPSVKSFFDRTGYVMPRTGDYTAAMILVNDGDLNELTGETVQEVLEDVDLDHQLIFAKTNKLEAKVDGLTDQLNTIDTAISQAITRDMQYEEDIKALEKKVEFLTNGFGAQEYDQLMRLPEDTTFIVNLESNNRATLQAAVDFVYSEVNLDGFTATILNPEDMSNHPTYIKGDPIGTGSLVISGSGLIGDIVLENCHQVIFDTCHFNGTVTVSDHSSVVFENCVFTAHAHNQLVVENHSFAQLRGLTTCKPGGENTLIFGVVEHDSILSLENGSTLQVNDLGAKNTYFRLFGASFRSTLDLRAATIEIPREHMINLYSLSVLMGTQSLPPNLQVSLEPDQFCVALP